MVAPVGLLAFSAAIADFSALLTKLHLLLGGPLEKSALVTIFEAIGHIRVV